MIDLSLLDTADTEWMDDAKCLTTDPNFMQPERATHADVEAAKRLCVGCPVIDQCRVFAESQAGAYGVHAGEWFGPDPVWLDGICESCGESFVRVGAQRFCSDRCRKRANRAKLGAA